MVYVCSIRARIGTFGTSWVVCVVEVAYKGGAGDRHSLVLRDLPKLGAAVEKVAKSLGANVSRWKEKASCILDAEPESPEETIGLFASLRRQSLYGGPGEAAPSSTGATGIAPSRVPVTPPAEAQEVSAEKATTNVAVASLSEKPSSAVSTKVATDTGHSVKTVATSSIASAPAPDPAPTTSAAACVTRDEETHKNSKRKGAGKVTGRGEGKSKRIGKGAGKGKSESKKNRRAASAKAVEIKSDFQLEDHGLAIAVKAGTAKRASRLLSAMKEEFLRIQNE